MVRTDGWRHPNKWLARSVLIAVCIWACAVAFGIRLSFVYTQLAFQVRAFLIFPLLFFALIYFAYFFKRQNQDTGYQQRMAQLSTKNERVKATLMGGAGILLISAGLAWTSVVLPAWATEIFASRQYSRTFEVVDIGVEGGPVWSAIFILTLRDSNTGESVTLPLRRSKYEKHRWKKREHICLLGRTWFLGTIIDETEVEGQQRPVCRRD